MLAKALSVLITGGFNKCNGGKLPGLNLIPVEITSVFFFSRSSSLFVGVICFTLFATEEGITIGSIGSLTMGLNNFSKLDFSNVFFSAFNSNFFWFLMFNLISE